MRTEFLLTWMRTPVSTGRVSSREAEGATRSTVCRKPAFATVKPCSAGNTGNRGKSAAGKECSEKSDSPARTSTWFSPDRCSSTISPAGRFLAMSVRIRAGRTTDPGSSTGPGQGRA